DGLDDRRQDRRHRVRRQRRREGRRRGRGGGRGRAGGGRRRRRRRRGRRGGRGGRVPAPGGRRRRRRRHGGGGRGRRGGPEGERRRAHRLGDRPEQRGARHRLVEGDEAPLGALVAEPEHRPPAVREAAPLPEVGDGGAHERLAGRAVEVEQPGTELVLVLEAGQDQPEEARGAALPGGQAARVRVGDALEALAEVDGVAEEPAVPRVRGVVGGAGRRRDGGRPAGGGPQRLRVAEGGDEQGP